MAGNSSSPSRSARQTNSCTATTKNRTSITATPKYNCQPLLLIHTIPRRYIEYCSICHAQSVHNTAVVSLDIRINNTRLPLLHHHELSHDSTDTPIEPFARHHGPLYSSRRLSITPTHILPPRQRLPTKCSFLRRQITRARAAESRHCTPTRAVSLEIGTFQGRIRL